MPNIATPWPHHWRYDADRIRCTVPNCGFIVSSKDCRIQWAELDDHCKNTPSCEHNILQLMLHQKNCAIGDCRLLQSGQQDYKIRRLFIHEKTVHDSEAMSHVCSFVRLARESRIRIADGHGCIPQPRGEELTFYRMVEKVQTLPAAHLELLFKKGGYYPDQYTRENLGKILTYDHLLQPGDDPPFWWPVCVENFLWFCRPLPTDPVDIVWENLWSDLRAKYADGRI